MDPRAAAVRPPALDIIIPARGEGATLEACLDSIADDAGGLDLLVVVIVNGPDRGATLEAAARGHRRLDSAGVPVRIIEASSAGKASALNRGDAERRGCAAVYLDADVTLLPGTLTSLAGTLSGSAAVLAAPPLRLAPSRSPITRAFARVWSSLPAVAGDVVGAGCYGVSAAGRERWRDFPDLVADDAFVRSCFLKAERRLTDSGGFVVTFPDGARLIRTVSRWHAGNRQLRLLPPGRGGERRDPGAGPWRNLAHVVRRVDVWPNLPAYLYVRAAAALVAYRGSGSAWAPVRQPVPRGGTDTVEPTDV
ncbi:glycosyltransferase [Phenylobacterium sp.]|uniref:glycosyltransferase n=1 Tax=Phenylobacterium sp. TaxID=1871053 RepID=UPI0025FAB35D|nr:glycosyltransferase [Phenylobacterium sp.]